MLKEIGRYIRWLSSFSLEYGRKFYSLFEKSDQKLVLFG